MTDQPDDSANKPYLPTYDGCFVCGQTHPSGICTRFYRGEEGRVHGLFRPTATQTSYANIVHGGIISAFLDELMGWPIALKNELICFTGEMTVRFRRQLFVGTTYYGTAYPGTKIEGKSYWDGSADLKDAAGEVFATSTGRFFLASEAQTRALTTQLRFEPGDLQVFKAPLPNS